MDEVKLTHTVSFEKKENTAILRINNPPVNALSQPVRDGLIAGINRAENDSEFETIMLICQGKTFFAGADINEFSQTRIGPSLLDVHEVIQKSRKPIIAAMHGTVLGGGLETALCCDFRIATKRTSFGLPEVKLGLLPGAGGTQRLPRLIGVELATEMMLTGKPISATQAHNVGLIDELIADESLEAATLSFAKRIKQEKRAAKQIDQNSEKILPWKNESDCATRLSKIKTKEKNQVAVQAILRCIEVGIKEGFAEGIAAEKREFAILLKSPESLAQRYYFGAERKSRKLPGLSNTDESQIIEKIGVVGAGTMGGGIAMNFANIGIPVTLIEANQEKLDKGLETIKKNYKLSVKSGRIKDLEMERRLSLITGCLDYESLHDCNLVIEAVFEDLSLKKKVFAQIDAMINPQAILATNSSGLDINILARLTSRPEKVLGLHFFSPANIMPLVEVVRADETSAKTLKTVLEVIKKIRKIGVVVGVCPGFVGNRMLYLRQHQAHRMALRGISPWHIDEVTREFGFPMGPFAMADLAGLDVGWNAKESKGETIRDLLCEQGKLGQKTGSGYYVYQNGSRLPHRDLSVEKLILEFAKSRNIQQKSITDQDILGRSMYCMVNEGAKILAEKKALRASDIDVIWVNGYGWPAYRGGPMYWADTIGLQKIVDDLKRFAEEDNDFEFWNPAPLLNQLIERGQKLADYSTFD